MAGHGETPTRATDDVVQPDDIALVLHTSGTTSRPKIVPLTHANICQSAQAIATTLRLSPEDRCLNVMPLFHIHGLMASLLASIHAGANVVCSSGFNSDEFFPWLKEFRPTWYSAVPTMHQSVLSEARRHTDVVSDCSLRFIRSSSSALPPQVIQQLEDVFQVLVIESYGMTEASHQMCSNPLPPATRKLGSVGIAAGPEVAIMDAEGSLREPNAVGEIVISGLSVTEGYENNPSANEEAFHDKWFRTGDQGRMDENGYVFITGRLKEIINRGGENISPREVDEALLTHSAIAQAVLFAVPHSQLGEDLAVAVVLREGAETSEEEVRQFAIERLADFTVPSQVLFVTSIPKGPTGKLQRIGLHDQLGMLLKPEFVEPQSVVEKALASIWREVLEVPRIGTRDNFFALGGDSLQATRTINRIREAFDVNIPLTAVFYHPTVEGLAISIETQVLDEV